MKPRTTKYTYGQFAKVSGRRYRVRKGTLHNTCGKCALHGYGGCRLVEVLCSPLIPYDAYFEKV